MRNDCTEQPLNPKMKRKQLFVDAKVQGVLAIRAMGYWFVCLATMFLMLLCWRIVVGPTRPFYMHLDDMWFFYGPAALASLVLLPLVVVDIIRVSNRFAGPLLRLRRSMRALARGEHVEPIAFRDGDFWQDFAEEFNQLAARVQMAEPTSDKWEPDADESQNLVSAGSS